jgi:hypothetical protein
MVVSNVMVRPLECTLRRLSAVAMTIISSGKVCIAKGGKAPPNRSFKKMTAIIDVAAADAPSAMVLVQPYRNAQRLPNAASRK